jgi:hypothetical protein
METMMKVLIGGFALLIAESVMVDIPHDNPLRIAKESKLSVYPRQELTAFVANTRKVY